MAWPPPLPTGVRANNTPQVNLHADDHNKINAALADLVAAMPKHQSIESTTLINVPASGAASAGSWGFAVPATGIVEVFCVVSCTQGLPAAAFDVNLLVNGATVTLGKGIGLCTVSLRKGLLASSLAGYALIVVSVNAWGGQPVTVERGTWGVISYPSGSIS